MINKFSKLLSKGTSYLHPPAETHGCSRGSVLLHGNSFSAVAADGADVAAA